MYEVKNMKCLEMFVIYNCLHKTQVKRRDVSLGTEQVGYVK